MPKMTIYATKDTSICSSNGSESFNFGKQPNIFINNTSKILIYFDLYSIPANATITSAKLNLCVNRFDSINTPINIIIKTLDSNFAEYLVTSENSPTSSPLLDSDYKSGYVYLDNLDKFTTFTNLTNTISSWHSNKSKNYGFELSTTDKSSVVGFYSKNFSSINLHPNLEIEYTVSIPDIPIIETTISAQILYPTDALPIETNIYNISNSLFFSYFIENLIYNNFNTTASISLKTSSTKDGTFENIGEIMQLAPNATSALEVFSSNKYVRLSVASQNPSNLNIYAIYKTIGTMIAPIVSSTNIVNNKIILTISTPPLEKKADPKAFKINLLPNLVSKNEIEVTSALVSDTNITLTVSDTSLLIYCLSINYAASGTYDIKCAHGDLLNFTNQPLPQSPSIVSSAKVYDDKIILTMNKPLTTLTANPKAFKIAYSPDNFFSPDNPDTPLIDVTSAIVSGSTITISYYPTPLFFGEPLLSYVKTGSNDLNGINGYVDEFVDKPITLSTETVSLPERLTLSSKQVFSTIYDTDKMISFKYIIDNTSTINTATAVTVSIQGSNTLNKDFVNIGNPLLISTKTTTTILVPKQSPTSYSYKYIRLSISVNPIVSKDTIIISAVYTALPEKIPGVVYQPWFLNSPPPSINLFISKPLLMPTNPVICDKAAFTINTSEKNLTVVSATINYSTFVAIKPSKNIPSTPISITYAKTGLNNLACTNGEIDNFTTICAYDANLPYVKYAELIPPISTGIYSDICHTDKTFNLTYSIYSGDLNVLVSLQDCDTKLGTFTNLLTVLVTPLMLDKDDESDKAKWHFDFIVPISKKYVRVLLKSSNPTNTAIKFMRFYYASKGSIPPNLSKNSASSPYDLKLYFDSLLTTKKIDISAFSISYLTEKIKINTADISKDSVTGNSVITMKLTHPIPSSYSSTLSYKATGTNDLKGDVLDVDNFSIMSLNLASVSKPSSVTITNLVTPTRTTIYDTLNFIYGTANFICTGPACPVQKDNFSKYSLTNKSGKDLTIDLQACDTITGSFLTISQFIVPHTVKDPYIIKLQKTRRYICLLISCDTLPTDSNLTIASNFKYWAPSKVNSSKTISKGSKIELTMSLALNDLTSSVASTFTITSPPSISVNTVLLSPDKLKLTLTLTASIKKGVPLRLSYKGDGINNITGVNGDVDNFDIAIDTTW